jgi:hypothetical protein
VLAADGAEHVLDLPGDQGEIEEREVVDTLDRE